MKQKITIKVQIACKKCRKQALKIAAGASGVTSVVAEGDTQLVVTGICVDPVALTAALRKKVGVAILVSVEEVKPQKKEEAKGSGDKDKKSEKGGNGDKEKKPEKEKEKPTPPPPPQPLCSYGTTPYYYPQPQPQPQYCVYEIPRYDHDQPCSIM